MNFIALETHAVRIASAREPAEFFDAALRVAVCDKSLQIHTNELIETGTKHCWPLSCSFNQLLLY